MAPCSSRPKYYHLSAHAHALSGGGGGHYSPGGDDIHRGIMSGGQYSPVNNVRGDIIHGGTLFTPTPLVAVCSLTLSTAR